MLKLCLVPEIVAEEETSDMRLRHVKDTCQRMGAGYLGTPSLAHISLSLIQAAQIILVDDKHKTMYCPVPKVACTTWKAIMMAIASGRSMEEMNRCHEGFYHSPNHQHELGLKVLADYTIEEQQQRLETYFKFLIMRNPFARFVSGFSGQIQTYQAIQRDRDRISSEESYREW